jgi:hypothetical protein
MTVARTVGIVKAIMTASSDSEVSVVIHLRSRPSHSRRACALSLPHLPLRCFPPYPSRGLLRSSPALLTAPLVTMPAWLSEITVCS